MGQSICTGPRAVGRWYVAETSWPRWPSTSTVTSARRTAERTLSRISFTSISLTATVLPLDNLTWCASPMLRSTTRTRGVRGDAGCWVIAEGTRVNSSPATRKRRAVAVTVISRCKERLDRKRTIAWSGRRARQIHLQVAVLGNPVLQGGLGNLRVDRRNDDGRFPGRIGFQQGLLHFIGRLELRRQLDRFGILDGHLVQPRQRGQLEGSAGVGRAVGVLPLGLLGMQHHERLRERFAVERDDSLDRNVPTRSTSCYQEGYADNGDSQEPRAYP